MTMANHCRNPPGRRRASRRKWKTTRWSRRPWNYSPRDKVLWHKAPPCASERSSDSMLGQARRPGLQRLQVSDQIVLLAIAEHVLIGRHPLPALIDTGLDIDVRQLLPVGHLVLLEVALQPWAHFLFLAVGVVAHRAGAFEYGSALNGAAFGRGQHYLGTGGQANAQREYTKSMHSRNNLQRSVYYPTPHPFKRCSARSVRCATAGGICMYFV